LAKRYDNDAILENYSCKLLFQLLEKHHILHGLDITQRQTLLDHIQQSILYTDMARHDKLLGIVANMKKDKLPSPWALPVLLHTADISNPCRPWKVALRWSDCILEEYFNQGVLEQIHGYPISPNMDRNSACQVDVCLGFVDKIVLPFFQEVADLLPISHVLIDQLTKNRSAWKAIQFSHSNSRIRFFDGMLDMSNNIMSSSSMMSSYENSVATSSYPSDESILSSLEMVPIWHRRFSTVGGEETTSYTPRSPLSPSKVETPLLPIDGKTAELCQDILSTPLYRRWSIQFSHELMDQHTCRRPSLISPSSSLLI
jgi:hypothetical protein